MPYAAGNLILLAHGNNKKLFKYETTADTVRTIASATATTYFGVIENGLDVEDLIWVKGSDAEGMFRVSAVGTNSTTVTVVPQGDVYAIPTASTTANLVPYGIFRSTGTTTTTYTLDMPWGVGQRKVLINAVANTALTVAMGSTVAGSIQTTGIQILFNGTEQSMELVAISTAKWDVAARAQGATAIIGPVIS